MAVAAADTVSVLVTTVVLAIVLVDRVENAVVVVSVIVVDARTGIRTVVVV